MSNNLPSPLPHATQLHSQAVERGEAQLTIETKFLGELVTRLRAYESIAHITLDPVGFVDATGDAHLTIDIKGGYLYWGDAPAT